MHDSYTLVHVATLTVIMFNVYTLIVIVFNVSMHIYFMYLFYYKKNI